MNRVHILGYQLQHLRFNCFERRHKPQLIAKAERFGSPYIKK